MPVWILNIVYRILYCLLPFTLRLLRCLFDAATFETTAVIIVC